MATTVAAPRPAAHAVPNRPNMVQVGTIIWLASELMFFAALFAMYFTVRSVSEVWPDPSAHFNYPFSITNTSILVTSSFTCQAGVFAAERFQLRRSGRLFDLKHWGMKEWFILTYLMGAFFVGGQMFEYTSLIQEGLTLPGSPYGSVFYLTTGFHGLHVTGGLIAFLFVLSRTFVAKRMTMDQVTTAIVVSYYWHFVDVVWIALYATIYLVR